MHRLSVTPLKRLQIDISSGETIFFALFLGLLLLIFLIYLYQPDLQR
jgi:hypothetical protein